MNTDYKTNRIDTHIKPRGAKETCTQIEQKNPIKLAHKQKKKNNKAEPARPGEKATPYLP